LREIEMANFFQEKRDEMRKRIVTAAKAYFIENGISPDTSMPKIAKAAGTTRQNLFKYFPEMDGLLVEVAKQGKQDYAAARKPVTAGVTGLQAIRHWMEDIFEDAVSGNEEIKFLMYYDVYRQTAKNLTEDTTQQYEEQFRQYWPMDDIRKGIEEGEIRADADPDEANFVITNIVVGLMIHLVSNRFRESQDPRHNAKLIAQVVMQMVENYLRKPLQGDEQDQDEAEAAWTGCSPRKSRCRK
jgi:AcrR family transcriptional regulator